MAQNIRMTALGQRVNIDQLRLINERAVAVGNMNVNARGDEVNPNGEIIKSRNEIMKDHYNRQIEPVVRYNPNKKKEMAEFLRQQQGLDTPVAEEVVPAEPLPPATHSPFAAPPTTELRGSLANSVNIDLTEPPPESAKTVRRI